MPDHETPPNTPPLLFVSYTPADEDWASWMAWELENSGYRVMLQAWDFVPGTNFIDFMDRGVAGAAAVIAVLSRSYLSSRFGRWEWQTAILANPDDPAAKLITVRVEECLLEGLLSTITYVDLVNVTDQHEAKQRLLDRVAQTLKGRAKPAARPAFPPLRLAAVAHDPAVLHDGPAVGELLGARLNLLLHGSSGKDHNLPFGRTPRGIPHPRSPHDRPGEGLGGNSGLGDDVLIIPAGAAGQHEILHLTAGGMTRWQPGAPGTPEELSRTWRSASATFPPPHLDDSAAPFARLTSLDGASLDGASLDGIAPGGADADEISGRAQSPAGLLLDQIAEVVEAGYPGAKLRRVAAADGPPHLLVTQADGGFVQQWRVAAHVGEVTREVVDAFAALVRSGGADDRAEFVYSGPRAGQSLRDEALRRGVRVRSYTEFQGLLDLRDYVDKQSERLQADQRYPHALYVPQR